MASLAQQISTQITVLTYIPELDALLSGGNGIATSAISLLFGLPGCGLDELR